MICLEKSINALLAERETLVNQIAAIDSALVILGGSAPIEMSKPMPPVEVTRVRPKRVLSDAHKAALVEGRRKARLDKRIAAGRPDEPVEIPALAARVNETPRLVKRNRSELTIEPDADSVGAFGQLAH